jgi:RNAse (barnase) inhibitor barstar
VRGPDPAPSMTERLRSVAPPWVHVLVLRSGQSLPAPPEGFVARLVSGRACASKPALMAELARVFAFPSYFGHNWDALRDCLTDLAWLTAPGYTLLFTDAHAILPRRSADFRAFLDVLMDVGRTWALPQAHPDARPGSAFHTVLVVPEGETRARRYSSLPTLDTR